MMTDINIIVRCVKSDNTTERKINISNKQHLLMFNFMNKIASHFHITIKTAQIFRNNECVDFDLDNVFYIRDCKFEDGDIFLINNPHIKATEKDRYGDINILIEWNDIKTNVKVKKENTTKQLYNLILNENVFKDNFCLEYDGRILDRFIKISLWDCGVYEGQTIKLHGELREYVESERTC